MVEAPRGPLIHHYDIEDGLIKKARFIIPTVHNNFSIERALTAVAKRYVKDGMLHMELEGALGWVVRAFDPLHCLCNPLTELFSIFRHRLRLLLRAS